MFNVVITVAKIATIKHVVARETIREDVKGFNILVRRHVNWMEDETYGQIKYQTDRENMLHMLSCTKL